MAGDWKAMMEEYKSMAEMYRKQSEDQAEMIKELTAELKHLRKSIEEEVKVGALKESNIDILFDGLFDFLDVYIKKETPDSIKKEMMRIGEDINLISMFGYDRLHSLFCVAYKGLLDGYLYIPCDKHVEVVSWVDSKCKDYNSRLKKAKKAHPKHYRGMFGDIINEKQSLTKQITKMELKGEKVPEDMLKREHILSANVKILNNIRRRITDYLRRCGMFLLYIEIEGIDISEVDADIFSSFQDYMAIHAEYTIDSINNIRRENLPFLEYLASEGYMRQIPRKGKGSIPKRRYEIETKPEPPEIFGVALDSRKRLIKDKCDMCRLYACIRSKKVGRDPKLLEICIRILRETGLRPVFAYKIQWGDFTKEPVAYVGKTPIYQLKLGRLRDFVVGKKGLPYKDMFISGLLGEMIIRYRKANPEITDRFIVFSGVKLFNWGKEFYADVIGSEQFTKSILLPLSEACGVKVRAEKFRDSYFTLMLDALNISEDDSFQRWTGDLRSTAASHYEAVTGKIKLPESCSGGKMNYSEIVSYIFDKEDY